ncbi:MAG: glycosyltransferase involved in cell wall biosynthesis, partial [Nitrospinales bacterium]
CVGDGNDLDNLKKLVVDLQLSNVGFHPPVIPSRLPEYFSIADIGVVSLNVSHNTHNIPGKFITYMHYGLPAFVVCNANNDLVDIVEQHDVGWVVSSVSEKHIAAGLLRALGDVGANSKLSSNCLGLASSRFSAKNAGQIIANALGV